MKKEDLKALLEDMSIEEKIGQLVQIPGFFLEGESITTGPAAEMGFSPEEIYSAGSTLSVFGRDKIKKIQDEFIKHHPHHIPLLFMGDIINGYKSIFPIPLAQGCSFDPDLVMRLASMAAREASVSGLTVNFSPMVDLVRDPRWGRVMESTGEDSYLNSVLAEAIVKGYQGDNIADHEKMAACVKHFAAYGAPVAGRDYTGVELSERTLRDDYLPSYKAAVDTGCELVMTSFNTIDRIPASANTKLMRDILRGEWEFDGVLISDWAAVSELVNHGIAKDDKEAATLAMRAGVDIDMCTPVYIKNLGNLINEGIISETMLDEAVLRVLNLKNKLGLFENPYHFSEDTKEEEVILCSEHRALCREAAEKSMVLLKNKESILPITDPDKKIAFIGPYVSEKHIFGAWSLLGDEKDVISVEEGVKNLKLKNKITFSKGCGRLDERYELYSFRGLESEEKTDEQRALEQAVKEAGDADIVVLMLGEHPGMSGEAGSRGDIRLLRKQRKLFKEIYNVNKNIVTLVFNGRPLDIKGIVNRSKAVIDAWFPGIEGGNAVARMLFGLCSPEGRLSMSFPYCVGQIPVHYDSFSTGRMYDGDKTNRFQSRYLDIPNEPLFEFGYGLSYTEFEYSDLTLSKNEMSKSVENDTITASVTLKNVGDRDGCETVQLYIRDMAGSVVRPLKKLKGFKKVNLKAGEETKVYFEINTQMLKFTDINMNYSAEPGTFRVFVGGSSSTDEYCEFELL